MAETCAVTATLLRNGQEPTGTWAKMHIVGMEGVEGLNLPFQIQLTFYYVSPSLLPDLLDKAVTLRLEYSNSSVRHINGILARMEHRRTITDKTVGAGQPSRTIHVYTAVLVPKIWKLYLNTTSRVFRGLKLDKIIEQVMTGQGVNSGEYKQTYAASPGDELSWLGGPRHGSGFRAQYRETDLDFISRLLEEFGVTYLFTHTAKNHVMHLVNKAAHFPACAPAQLTLRTAASPGVTGAYRFSLRRQLTSERAELRDHNPSKTSPALSQTAGAQTTATIADYPGGFNSDAQGKAMAQVRLEEARAEQVIFHGESDFIGLIPGHTFNLTGAHQGSNMNRDYVVLRVGHSAANSDPGTTYASHTLSYSNTFECVQKTVPYRPPRVTPRPTVRGVQTATVVGPDDGTVAVGRPHVDASGRIQIRFHWQADTAASSCPWVRVAQRIGDSPDGQVIRGSMLWPRVGDEVVVEFLEGDPDRPLITGTVYPTDKAYPGPRDPTSTETIRRLKPRSRKVATKGDTVTVQNNNRNLIQDGDTEFTMVDDGTARVVHLKAAGSADKPSDLITETYNRHEVSEHHYQYVGQCFRQHVGSDVSRTTSGNHDVYIKEGSTTEVGGDASTTVRGNASLRVDGELETLVKGDVTETYGDAFSQSVDGNYGQSVSGDYSRKVSGDYSVKVDGTVTSVAKKKEDAYKYGDKQSGRIGSEFKLAVGPVASVFVGPKLDIKLAVTVAIDLAPLMVKFTVGLLAFKLNATKWDVSIHMGYAVSTKKFTFGYALIKLDFNTLKIAQSKVELKKTDLNLDAKKFWLIT